jgi:polyhydroxybutyrate depolymerase
MVNSSLVFREDHTAGSKCSLPWGLAAPLALGSVALGVSVLRLVLSLRAFFRVNGQLKTGKTRRRYLLHVPEGLDPSRLVPLVVVIHGFMQSPAHQAEMSRWDELADAEGFITVYPMGTGFPLRWSAHEPGASSQDTRDHVDFIRHLVDTICEAHSIDPGRIYASGMSNGGGLASVLACELPDVFAAVGSVAGLYTYPPDGPTSGRPVPLIAFHGLLDRIVPIGGGVRRLRYGVPAVADWMDAYARRCGCTVTSDERLSEALGQVRYSGGPDHVEVIWYTIHDGGHTWPGGVPLPEVITGPTSNAIDATRATWEFFTRHARADVQPSRGAVTPRALS